jgi:urease accessory protein UreE
MNLTPREQDKLLVSVAAMVEIEAADRASVLQIAWPLGNRHLPLQGAGDRLRIRQDLKVGEGVKRIVDFMVQQRGL